MHFAGLRLVISNLGPLLAVFGKLVNVFERKDAFAHAMAEYPFPLPAYRAALFVPLSKQSGQRLDFSRPRA
jgi:hypothetical protein